MRNLQIFGFAAFTGIMFFLSDVVLTRIEGYPPYISRKRLYSGAFWIAFFVLYCLISSAQAQELSQDYQQGFCDGAKSAYDTSMRNRDHNRQLTASLMGKPFETHEEAIKRIYAEQGKDWCLHGPTIVHDSECLMLDRIDLYVVLPPWQGGRIVTPKGMVDCGGEFK